MGVIFGDLSGSPIDDCGTELLLLASPGGRHGAKIGRRAGQLADSSGSLFVRFPFSNSPTQARPSAQSLQSMLTYSVSP